MHSHMRVSEVPEAVQALPLAEAFAQPVGSQLMTLRKYSLDNPMGPKCHYASEADVL